VFELCAWGFCLSARKCSEHGAALVIRLSAAPLEQRDYRQTRLSSQWQAKLRGQAVVFVANEGPYQGRVLSAIVPDASQIAQWGL
jgi:hypothetical protein